MLHLAHIHVLLLLLPATLPRFALRLHYVPLREVHPNRLIKNQATPAERIDGLGNFPGSVFRDWARQACSLLI